MASDAPTEMLVATTAFMIGTSSFCVWTGAALFYQARGLSSALGSSVVLAPPLVMRVATIVIATSLGIVAAAVATVNPQPRGWQTLVVAFFALAFITSRLFVARFEADHWGIRCTNPLKTVRIPWTDVRSLEPRGNSALLQRIVVVTDHGRGPMLWVADPRVPISRDAARLLVAELEAVRESAAKLGA